MRGSKAVREYYISLYRSLNPFKDLKALLQTVKLIKKEKTDVIHCHSNKDCVKNGINGYLLPMNVSDFADKIVELAQNDELRNKMGKESRELFIDEFYIENRIHLLQEKYEEVISQ